MPDGMIPLYHLAVMNIFLDQVKINTVNEKSLWMTLFSYWLWVQEYEYGCKGWRLLPISQSACSVSASLLSRSSQNGRSWKKQATRKTMLLYAKFPWLKRSQGRNAYLHPGFPAALQSYIPTCCRHERGNLWIPLAWFDRVFNPVNLVRTFCCLK